MISDEQGSVAAIVVDKFNFYLSTFIFFIATVTTTIASGYHVSLPPIEMPHIIIGVAIATVLVLLGKLFGRRLISKIPFDQIRRINKHRFVSSLALNIVVRVLKTLEPILILFVLGVHLEPAQIVLMSSLMVVSSTVVGVLPTQVGTKEMGQVAVMHLIGIPLEIYMSVIVIQKIRELLFAAFGLIIWAKGTRLTSATSKVDRS